MITVIGLHDPAALPPALRDQIATCDLLAGGARQLAWFPEATGERAIVDAAIPALLDRLHAANSAGRTIVVLASGDPLWYGIGTTLRRSFDPTDLQIVAAPTAVQLAFAALAEPWHAALTLSAHGRPLEPVVDRIIAERRLVAVLTDGTNTPAAIATALLAGGYGDAAAAVCERLASPRERIIRAPLSTIAGATFDPLNVLVVWPPHEPPTAVHERQFGLTDDEVEHDGLITHLEVRAVALALLRLHPSSIVWDIGAGSGAVSLEAARLVPRGQVYAVEQAPARVERMRHNLDRWGSARITLQAGMAPDACRDWPMPDAVFVGGSGGHLNEIVTFAAERLRPAGRVVIDLVTLELLAPALTSLHAAGFVADVRQVAVSRSRPLLGNHYLAALNPVYIVTGSKGES